MARKAKEVRYPFSIALSDHMWLRIARYCMVHGISRSEAIRRLVDVGLDDCEVIPSAYPRVLRSPSKQPREGER